MAPLKGLLASFFLKHHVLPGGISNNVSGSLMYMSSQQHPLSKQIAGVTNGAICASVAESPKRSTRSLERILPAVARNKETIKLIKWQLIILFTNEIYLLSVIKSVFDRFHRNDCKCYCLKRLIIALIIFQMNVSFLLS